MQKFFNFFLFAELLQRLVEYLWFCYCGGKHRGCSHGWICSKCSNLFYTPLNNFPVFPCSFIIWWWWVRETAFHGLHFPVGRMFTFCHHQSSITSYQGNFTVIILILESLLCWKAEEKWYAICQQHHHHCIQSCLVLSSACWDFCLPKGIGKWLRYSENQAVAAGSSWVTEKKSFDIEEAGIVTLILIAPRLLLGEGRKK